MTGDNMKKTFTIPASDRNLKWCDQNLMEQDWSIQENNADITIYYDHPFQKDDILNVIDSLG